MKKLLAGTFFLISMTCLAGEAVIYTPVLGINSAKKGIRVYQDRAENQMIEKCSSLNGEVVRFSCSTEKKQDLSVVACAGICKIHFENEINVSTK